MAYSQKLSAADALAAGDYLSLFQQAAGDWRGATVALLTAYMQANLTFTGPEFTTQYAAPTATGFTTNVLDGAANVWLVLTPLAGYAAGTIKLPATANAADKQEVLVHCTQAVTTLTVNGNGGTVAGAPATLAANDFFRLKYDAANTTWYRVG